MPSVSWGSNSQSKNYSFLEKPAVDSGCFTVDVADSDGQRISSMPGSDESGIAQPQRCVSALKAQMEDKSGRRQSIECDELGLQRFAESSCEEDIVLEVFGPRRTHHSTGFSPGGMLDIISPRPSQPPTALGLQAKLMANFRERGDFTCSSHHVSPLCMAEHESGESETARLSVTLEPVGSESSSGEEAFFGSAFLPDSRSFPRSMTQRDRFPLYAGDSSNIYRGSIIHPEGHKIQVAIKLLRIIVNDAIQLEDILKRLKREALAWSEITHPNLHPFIGMYDIGAPFPVLISPFCKFGHIGNYLTEYPLTNRSLLVHGVASGLKHLHDKDIVHGDLKLQNILIDKRGVACICDFGVSKIINPDGFTTWSVETLTYIAPELLISSDPRNASVTRPQITKSSDVYSFALLVLEILTSESPRRPASLDRLLTNVKFLGGFRPQRAHYDVAKLTHQMWSVLDQCWNPEPQLRPTMAKILLSPGFGALRR